MYFFFILVYSTYPASSLFSYLKNFSRPFCDCLKSTSFFLGWSNAFGASLFDLLCWFVLSFFSVCTLCSLFSASGSGTFGWCSFSETDVTSRLSRRTSGTWDCELTDWERGDGMPWCRGPGNCRCSVCLTSCFPSKPWIGHPQLVSIEDCTIERHNPGSLPHIYNHEGI